MSFAEAVASNQAFSHAAIDVGSIASPVLTLLASTVIASTPSGATYLCDSTAGNMTVTLPSITGNPGALGFTYTFVKIAAANTLTIIVTPGSGNTCFGLCSDTSAALPAMTAKTSAGAVSILVAAANSLGAHFSFTAVSAGAGSYAFSGATYGNVTLT